MTDFFDEVQAQLEDDEKLRSTPAKTVTLRNTEPCTDDYIMTFGKYKGMQVKDVPASYLLWWLDQTPTTCPSLLAYIAKNKRELEKERDALDNSGYYDDYDEDDSWGDI